MSAFWGDAQAFLPVLLQGLLVTLQLTVCALSLSLAACAMEPLPPPEATLDSIQAIRASGLPAIGVGAFQSLAEDGIPGRRLGRVNDAELRALYENAACLLFPSRYEGFGLPPVEAMACGCPVIAARGGAVEEICQDGALYFANGENSITDALEILLDDGDLAEALRQRGQARAAELSWDVSARALGAVVRRVS